MKQCLVILSLFVSAGLSGQKVEIGGQAGTLDTVLEKVRTVADYLSVTKATQKSAPLDWPVEDGAKAFYSVTGDTLFKVGGWTGGVPPTHNEIWFSVDDGMSWTQAADAAWAPRHGFPLFRHGSYFYLIGSDPQGWAGRDEVWRSSNGLTWTAQTTTAAFGHRTLVGAAVLGNDFYVVGGQDTTSGTVTVHKDVWKSTDLGVTWTQICSSCAPQIGNLAGTMQGWNGRLWIIAGNTYNEPGASVYFKTVYSSNNGTNWKLHKELPIPEAGLSYPETFVWNGRLAFYGGYNGSANTRHLMYTNDGDNWLQFPNTLSITHAAAVALMPNDNCFVTPSGNGQSTVDKACFGEDIVLNTYYDTSIIDSDTFLVSEFLKGMGTVDQYAFFASPDSLTSSSATRRDNGTFVHEKNTSTPIIGFFGGNNAGGRGLVVSNSSTAGTNYYALSESAYGGSVLTPFYIERRNSANATFPGRVTFANGSTFLNMSPNQDWGFATQSLSPWPSTYVGINMGRSAALLAEISGFDQFHFLDNAYYDGSWKYRTTQKAAGLNFTEGDFTIQTAPSGTADAAITWVNQLRIPNVGGVNIGTGAFTAAAGVGNFQTGFRINNLAPDTTVAGGDNTNYIPRGPFWLRGLLAPYFTQALSYSAPNLSLSLGGGSVNLQDNFWPIGLTAKTGYNRFGTSGNASIYTFTNNSLREKIDSLGNLTQTLENYTGTFLGGFTAGVNGNVQITSSGTDSLQFRTSNNIFGISDTATFIDAGVYLRDYPEGDVTVNENGKLIPKTPTDTVYVSFTPIELGTVIVQVAGTDFLNDGFTVPTNLAGYDLSLASYRMFTNTATTGSLTIGLRKITTAGTPTANIAAVTYGAGDVFLESSSGYTTSAGDILHAEVGAGTGTLDGVQAGLTVTLMFTR